MRIMHWSWHELMMTPAHVIEELLLMLREREEKPWEH